MIVKIVYGFGVFIISLIEGAVGLMVNLIVVPLLPDRNIAALINHIGALFGEKESIELIGHTIRILCLADRGVNA